MNNKKYYSNTPDSEGYFGEYGGQILPPELKQFFDVEKSL